MFQWYLVRVEKEIGKRLKCWDLIEEDNSLQINLNYSIMIEESKDRHPHLEPLHRMELLREEIDLSWTILED